MNIKGLLFCIGLLLPFSLENIALCGRLDYSNKDVIDSDPTGEDRTPVPVRKIIKEILTKDEDELKEITSLNLSKNTIQGPGLNILIEDLIPRLPNLQILDLSYNLIGEKGLDPLYTLLQVNNTLKYISLSGNGIARLISKKAQEMEENSPLRQKIAEKVIFTPKSMISEVFPSSSISFVEKCRETHEQFYKIEQ